MSFWFKLRSGLGASGARIRRWLLLLLLRLNLKFTACIMFLFVGEKKITSTRTKETRGFSPIITMDFTGSFLELNDLDEHSFKAICTETIRNHRICSDQKAENDMKLGKSLSMVTIRLHFFSKFYSQFMFPGAWYGLSTYVHLLWTRGLSEFCKFSEKIYTNILQHLVKRKRKGSSFTYLVNSGRLIIETIVFVRFGPGFIASRFGAPKSVW